ncbi:hypothetical protein D3C87_512150 [compost metagenome]
MSYNTLSLITSLDNDDEFEKLKINFIEMLEDFQIRKFNHPFKGVVAQYNLKNSDKSDKKESTEQIVKNISRLYQQKKIALIEVDCFGGKCDSEGKIYANGDLIAEEDYDHTSHFKLLKIINDNYQTWHFEPFTREFFTKKGGIWGQINDEELIYFGLGIATAFQNNPLYRVQMTHNELILEKKGEYYIYLMQPLSNRIKILGSIDNDSNETLEDLKNVLKEHILYAKSYVFLDLIDKDEFIKLVNLEDDEMTEALYRFQSFNDRPFPSTVDTNNEKDEKEQATETEDILKKEVDMPVNNSWWDKIMRLFGG